MAHPFLHRDVVSRPHCAVRSLVGGAVGAALGLSVLTVAALPASAALQSKSHKATTTTTAATTTTTAAGAAPSAADRWLIEAIGAETKVGSVRVAGTITQGKTSIRLNILVNGDGEGGGSFVQDGYTIALKRVGPILYFNAPKKFWATHATAAQTAQYGGKWIEVSALDSRFTSFDQFLNAGDLVTAVFEGHTTPLSVSKPTTYQGHKVVIVKDTVVNGKKKSYGLMYVAATGTPVVLKITDNTPGELTTLSFSHYGKPVSITVPAEPINLT